jgi:hypothetical protein
MWSDNLTNRINATIDCPLKLATIAWSKCEFYRGEYGCLCREARERLRIKGQGTAAYQAQLQRIKQPIAEAPEGWTVVKGSRFYVITDEAGEIVTRATNQKEATLFLSLAARVNGYEMENRRLWALLRDDLIEEDRPDSGEFSGLQIDQLLK